MKNFVKFALLAIVAASATVASAADLEFHGYARIGFGFNSAGGNQVAFMLNESGKSKFRLGNEADACLEPGFTYSFTKLDDKSVWGVHMLPAVYRRMNNPNSTTVATGKAAPDDTTKISTDGNNNADGGLNVSYKEFYFYGQNIPQLGGGELWVGRRYFGRNYLGAINDSFLEAQDGFGGGLYDIPVGPAKLSFDLAAPGSHQDGSAAVNTDLSIGAHVTSIPTFNKDSNLQVWARVYVPMQKTSGDGTQAKKRDTGFSASAMHVAGFGTAGNLTLAARFDQNASTDQQDNGANGKRNIEADVVYGVNIPSARTSIDAMAGWRQSKSVKDGDAVAKLAYDDTMNLFIVGARSDTQISGPFRFLLEVGFDSAKTKKVNTGTSAAPVIVSGKNETLLKITPVIAISGGNDPWSRPTFRFFYTYASWNKDARGSVAAAWKDQGVGDAFAGKDAGGSFGVQAEGWW